MDVTIFRKRSFRQRKKHAFSASMAAIWIVFALAIAGAALIVQYSDYTGEGNWARQVAYLGLAALSLWIMAQRSAEDWNALPWLVSVTIAWCLVSVLWATAPDVSLRRAVLVSIVIFAIFIAVRNEGYTGSVDALRSLLLVVLVLNFAAAIFVPSFGIHQIGEIDDPNVAGDWRGIVMHKNLAGAVSAFVVLLFVFDADKVPRWKAMTTIGAALLFLYLSGSKTSSALLAASCVVGALFRGYRPRHRNLLTAAFVLMLALAIAVAFAYQEQLVAEFSRPDSFTGRVQIWPLLVQYIAKYPATGAGYGSFWNVGVVSPIYTLEKVPAWIAKISSGHNGYLDVAAQIGLPGLALAVVAFIIQPIWLILTWSIQPRRRMLLLSLLVFCTGHNFSESSLLDRDAIVQVVLTFTVALVYASIQRKAGPTMRAQ